MHNLIGHKVALDILTRMAASGRLGPGVILVGAGSIGKRKLAEMMIMEIEGNGEEIGNWKLETHPDVAIIQREMNDKGELKKNISIEQIRGLIQRLSMSSFTGGRKIGIIDGAQALSTDAANALLKTLEDPAGDVLVLMLATSVATLPATVLSRCQLIHLSLVSREEICNALVALGAGRETAHEIAGLAAGRPGVALRLWQDAELFGAYKTYQTNVLELARAPLHQRFGRLGEVVKTSRADLWEMLDVWETALHDSGELGLLGRLVEARRAIAQNVSPQLAMEHAFI